MACGLAHRRSKGDSCPAYPHGHVSDRTWDRAISGGWDDSQLAEAFAYLGLSVFTGYFLNYAATEPDVPAGVPGGSAAVPVPGPQ
jgi:hypothetical protein